MTMSKPEQENPKTGRKQRRAQAAYARKSKTQEASRRAVTKAMKVHLPVLIEDVHRRLANTLQEQIEHSEQKPSCTKGCASCCEQLVLISTGEAILILEHHAQLFQEQQEPLRAQADISRELCASQNINPDTPQGAQTLEALSELWWEKRVPCVFLDASTKACRIYDQRPISCRTHMVSSDPALCSTRADSDGGADVEVDLITSPARDLAYQSLQKEETQFMQSMSLGPMASVLLSVRANLKKWS